MAVVALHANLDELAARKLERVRHAADDVRLPILIRSVWTLAGVQTDGDDTVIAGALQAAGIDVPKHLSRTGRRPHQRGAIVALSFRGAVDAIGPLHRCAVLAGLHVDPAERHLRLSRPNAEE